MKIKILFIIENVSFGGGERAFSQIIAGLDKTKYKVYVACASGGLFQEKVKSSAEILPFSLQNRFNVFKIHTLARMMKEKDIQIVHSQGARADFFTRIAARRAKVPVVISTVTMPVEGFDVGVFKKRAYIALDRFTEKFVHRFVVVSEALKERLIAGHTIQSGKITKISNGIELEEYSSSPELSPAIREEFKASADTKLVGSIARLVWQKGLVYFVRAIDKIVRGELKSSEAKIKFLLVGEGNERKKLEMMVKKFGLEDKVVFTGFRQDTKAILEALDIVVLPSVQEGQPLILLEAMAMAKPIVATDIEGVNETLTNGQTGILVSPGDSTVLAKAIADLLKDTARAKMLGRQAREVVQNKFNLKDTIEQYQILYEESISAKRVG